MFFTRFFVLAVFISSINNIEVCQAEIRPPVNQSLIPTNSNVKFNLSSPLFSGTGSIYGVSGTMATSPTEKLPSKVMLQANIRQLKFQPSKPEQLFMFETLRAALPFDIVKFESSSITTSPNGQILVAGKATVKGKTAQVSIPVKIERSSSSCSTVTGSYSGETEVGGNDDGPSELALPLSGNLQFRLQFAANGTTCPVKG